MNYADYHFLWPPRPKRAIPPSLLGFYEDQGWWAQVKRNGTGSVIFVSPDKEVITRSRHDTEHRAWQQTNEVMAWCDSLPGTGWYVFVTELMHNKTRNIKNVNYINDMLVRDGKYLVGTTFADRQEQIRELFGLQFPTKVLGHWEINDHLWVACNYREKFADLFEMLRGEGDEGLVLKDPDAKLSFCSKADSNTKWQIKCRSGTKNFGF